MALVSGVHIRTHLALNRTFALGNLRASRNKNKTLREAFRLQVGTSIVTHAS